MKLRHLSLSAICLAGVLAVTSSSWAETIAVFSGALTAKDPTQQGRLSRNGIIADWSSVEPFPGVINTSTTYYYTEYVITAAMLAQTPFVQVDFDSVSLNTFISAYAGSYNPTDPAATYLGDEGQSGNYFGVDPATFQVIVPADTDLVLVINNTGAGGVGLGDPFILTVEGFIDTEFDDPPPAVPEPSTLVLLGSGLAGIAGAVRRKLKANG